MKKPFRDRAPATSSQAPSRAAARPITYRVIMAVSSAVLATVFATSAVLASRMDDRRLASELRHEADRLKTAFEVAQNDLEVHLLAIAGVIADAPGVSRLLADANARRADDARLATTRTALRGAVDGPWNGLREQIGLREMQFVLRGGQSFLNLHAPGEFGDRLLERRPMLRDVEITEQAHSGLEAGRTLAGLRGAVPVFGADGLLATVEVAVPFDAELRRLAESTGARFGVLLRPENLSPALRDRYRPRGAGPGANLCCALAAATAGELAGWLTQDRLPAYDEAYQQSLIEWHGRTYQVIRFPLRDYLGRKDPARPAAGSVVIWRDIGDALVDTATAKRNNRLAAAAGFLLAQLLVAALIRWSRREWRAQLDDGTAEIRRLSEQNRALLMAAADGIFCVDVAGNCTLINPAAQKLVERAPNDLLGHSPHALFHHRREDGAPYPESECPIFKTLGDGEPRESEEWFLRADGSGFPVQQTVAATFDHGRVSGAVVIFRDITGLKRKAAALVEAASTDSLTGLLNRRAFIEQLLNEMARQQRTPRPLSLLMIDLDHFKNINDRYGHAAGDAALRHFAELARGGIRAIDAIGRLGGEEFAILLPDSSAEQAMFTGERLRAACAAKPARHEMRDIAFTISVGVAVVTPTDRLPDAPLQRADHAMYRAKAVGRNRVMMASTPETD